MESIRFHITVKGIVVFKQKVLLMKRVRPSSDGLGYWELPGGGLEYGETPNEALKRELKEENATYAELADYYKVSLSGFKRFIRENIPNLPSRRKKKNDTE